MKSVAVIALALACIIGMAAAQFGYGGFPAQQGGSGFGNGGLLALFGLLFLVTFLFNGNNRLGTGSTTLIYGNFSAPTGK
ncbi:hypothetical protein DPMN_145671 [Dreissena polymorpha]|uniref:Protein-export membrane protein SecG n=1 Tax=Dreissena polymorpha TaxID=45954 RepID=A0A9D4F904_DREPO|nr:hypothetical protein DPMN_145671 [Dreissena polymorpha]